jgi:hypothetical protein
LKKDFTNILDKVGSPTELPNDFGFVSNIFSVEKDVVGGYRVDVLMAGSQVSDPSSLREDEDIRPADFKMRRYYRKRDSAELSPTSNGIDLSREALEGLASQSRYKEGNKTGAQILRGILAESLNKVEKLSLPDRTPFKQNTPLGKILAVVRRGTNERVDDLSVEEHEINPPERSLENLKLSKKKNDNSR